MAMYGSLLAKVPFFLDDSTFLREVSVLSLIQHYTAGDVILYGMDMGRELFCIKKGRVKVKICR